MLKILAPIDGSNNSARVIDYLIQFSRRAKSFEVCVINVRDVIDSPQVHRFWSADQIRDFQQKEGNLLLEPARKRLEESGVRHAAEVVVGDVAQTIAAQAKAKGCDMIVMGTRGMGTIGNLLMGSVATKVVHLAEMPITLVK
jgi:nucleotide-binding universal stress UspA family protein